MAGGIFISYRRDDARQAAGRLADDLADHVGADHIFRDIEGIELGVDFTQALNQALETCVVMLVLIGPQWLGITDAQGRRRLDQPRDWIRLEIATALQRGIRVVPLLLDGTPLPDEDELPDDLKPLVRRQALEIADSRWRGDLQRLAETLARVPGLQVQAARSAPIPAPLPPAAPVPAAAGRSGRGIWVGMGIGAFGLLALVVNLAQHGDVDSGAPAPAPAPAPSPGPAPSPVAAPVQAPAAPAPVAAVNPPVAAPALPDVSGTWRTLDGEVYQFRQQGRQLSFIAQAGGLNVGSGQGEFDGAVMRLAMSLVVNGVPLGVAQCQLQASPDVRRFVGMCQGPNGPFPAQMFR